MKLDKYKEITPIFFNDSSVKVISFNKEPFENCFPLHWHERIEFLYILKGSLKLMINEKWEEFFPGDIAIICPKQLHQGISGENGSEYFCVMFEPAILKNSTPSSDKYINPIITNQILFNNRTRDPEISDTLLRILNTSSQKAIAGSIRLQGLVYTLIGLLYRNLTVMKKPDLANEDKFNSIIDYVNENFVNIVNTKTLSKEFGYDESYFCRKFKAVTGLSVMKYIKILRLEQAQYMLKETAENVHKIASVCGFNDHCYFTRSFHEYYGYTPSEFREKALKTKRKMNPD